MKLKEEKLISHFTNFRLYRAAFTACRASVFYKRTGIAKWYIPRTAYHTIKIIYGN